jgi:hypothetical protein
MVRISKDELRGYERGDQPVPPDVYARLVDCYGDVVPARVAARVADGELIVGDQARTVDDYEIARVYVELVQQLRRTKPGDALPLRVDDLVALATALDTDADVIEQRMIDMLGCSRGEAKALHRELMRRKIVLPVAGLAAGIAAVAGMQAAAAHDAPRPGPVVAPPTTAITMAPPSTEASTTVVAPTTTVAPRPVVSTAPTAPAVVHHAPPPTPPATPPSTAMPRPVISPDDTVPEGVLPGEHPLPAPTTTSEP